VDSESFLLRKSWDFLLINSMIDETEPLLGHARAESIINGDQKLVDFDPNGDSENPLDWSRAYKLEVVALLSFMAFTV